MADEYWQHLDEVTTTRAGRESIIPLFLRYRIEELAFERTVALSSLEAATLRYALHRAGAGALSNEDRSLVNDTLQRLGRDLIL